MRQNVDFLFSHELRYSRLEFTDDQVSYLNNEKLSLKLFTSVGRNYIKDLTVIFGESILLINLTNKEGVPTSQD